MKHYRLKKDLPTFKAGQTFHTDAQGNLWLDEGQGPSNHWLAEVRAYHHRTIEHFPNILEDWFDEIAVPDPAYLVTKIQKLENSVKAQAKKMDILRDGINELHERLKMVEKSAERPPREGNNQILEYRLELPPRVVFERMKQDLRDWIEKNQVDEIRTFIHTEPDGRRGVRRGVRFIDKNHPGDNHLIIVGWPTIGLTDGAVYAPDELLITGEAGKE